MRKNFWVSFLCSFLLIALGSFAVSALQDSDEGLKLISPSACPSSGCAAGQRLNFTVQFSVDPQITGVPNTQVCVYAPVDGQSGSGTEPWADFSKGWIAEGASAYTAGEVDSVCTNAAPTGDQYLAGVYASHPSAIKDQVDFALHITPTTDIDGHVQVKVLQLDSSNNWTETSNPSETYTVPISVAPLENTAYVAETTKNCGTHSPCFVSSQDYAKDGLGTGLYDAIQALNPEGMIIILKDIYINHSIRIDKELTIKGNNWESMLTSNNSSEVCGTPLLTYYSSGVLQNLTINDGNCSTNKPRNLVEIAIDSPNKVIIQNNTLTSGNHAIYILDKTELVDIAFNEITNNQQNAVFIEANPTNTGEINIFANNILNNGFDPQVICNFRGIANHNFWGEGQSAAENTSDCNTESGKELGAPILAASDGHGVQAILGTVKKDFIYFDYFNGKIGARHNGDSDDYDIVIVNHGQGETDNIPFFESGSGDIVPCGNFYDIFLADDANPKNLLEVALKYDLNDQCINIIESDYYCGNSDPERYPLWWYDPVGNVTSGWDRTGQTPQGSGGTGESGQMTHCNTQQDEIIVTIDNSGRPGLFSDLTFTPFTTGFIDGAPLTDFSAEYINFYSKITWQTSREKNIKRYELLKSKNKDSGYEIITKVDVTSDSFTPNTYQYYDYDVKHSNTYYYKLLVIHKSHADEIIGRHGPLTLNVPAPTATTTPTVTHTLIPTSTPAYQTPTRAYYRSATPAGTPTQVRTYGPSPTGGTKPAFNPSPTSTTAPDTGYPSGDQSDLTETAMSAYEGQTITPTELDAASQETQTPPIEKTNDLGPHGNTQNGSSSQTLPPGLHFLIGFAGGLALLLGASLIFAKLFFL